MLALSFSSGSFASVLQLLMLYEPFSHEWQHLHIDTVLPPLEATDVRASVWNSAFNDRNHFLELFPQSPEDIHPSFFDLPGDETQRKTCTTRLTAARIQATTQARGRASNGVPSTTQGAAQVVNTLTRVGGRGRRPFVEVSAAQQAAATALRLADVVWELTHSYSSSATR